MHQLTCFGCGQKVAVKSFLTAAEEKCTHCGKPVIAGGDEPPLLAPASVPAAVRQPWSADRKRIVSGAVTGALLGGALVPLVGYFGGPIGPPFVGAVGGATSLTLAVFVRAGALQNFLAGLITGDHSWFDLWMIVAAFFGMALGMSVGMMINEVTPLIAGFGALGGAIAGGLAGAVFFPAWAATGAAAEVADLS